MLQKNKLCDCKSLRGWERSPICSEATTRDINLMLATWPFEFLTRWQFVTVSSLGPYGYMTASWKKPCSNFVVWGRPLQVRPCWVLLYPYNISCFFFGCMETDAKSLICQRHNNVCQLKDKVEVSPSWRAHKSLQGGLVDHSDTVPLIQPRKGRQS